MNLERLICVGVNHQSAPLELREKLSQWPLRDLRTEQIDELIILSTCNRLELYAYLAAVPSDEHVVDDDLQPALFQPLTELVTTVQPVRDVELEGHLYFYHGETVAKHLCEVAAGLDSIVMGEGQILGQVNGALQRAYTVKSVGQALSLLFRTAITAGKRARTETRISANPVSISSAAVALAAEVTGDLRNQRIAVVGLGEMGQLALKGLRARGVSDLLLLNRTFARAETLSGIYGGEALAFGTLPDLLHTVDIVITATSAVAPIVDTAMVAHAMAQRSGRPLTLIDLSVPRNIDAGLKNNPTPGLANVTLYDVDDMRLVIDDAFAARQAEVPRVRQIIDELLVEWHEAVTALQFRPLIVGLRRQAEQKRQQVVARTVHQLERQMGTVDEATTTQLHHLSRALVNQLLHAPTVKMKEKSREADGAAYAAMLCEFFDLDIPLPYVGAHSAQPMANETDASFDLSWFVATGQGDGQEDGHQEKGQEDDPVCGCALMPLGGNSADLTCHSKIAHSQYELVGQP